MEERRENIQGISDGCTSPDAHQLRKPEVESGLESKIQELGLSSLSSLDSADEDLESWLRRLGIC